MEYDFSGYATRNDLQCSDGRTIRAGAFKDQHGKDVPLLWQHGHNSPENVLGHATLENRDDGVYAYCKFNDTNSGKNARALVEHGDVVSLSIYANGLVERAKNVIHGKIRELSLVLSGANPGAFIDNIILQHGEMEEVLESEAIIYTGLTLEHEDNSYSGEHNDNSDEGETVPPVTHAEERTVSDVFESMTEEQKNITYFMIGEALSHDDDDDYEDADEEVSHADGGEKTVQDVFNSMSEEQKNVVYFMIGEALSSSEGEAAQSAIEPDENTNVKHNQEGPTVRHNIFENRPEEKEAVTLSHSDIKNILTHAQSLGSVREAVQAYALKHGIDDIDVLFPDAKAVTNTPDFIARRTEWVQAVLSGTKHTPFSRIKTVTADITMEEARAKGYVKGNLKKEEFFSLAKRTTGPQTIYKKQKLDRDDIVDITDFDVVVWLKAEMRLMLEEELARAILVGDGRSNADEDKIKEDHIRPIATDDDLYQTTVYVNVDDPDSSAEEIIDAVTLNRRHYRGSGNPTFFTSETYLAKMLMVKDGMKRRIYNSVEDLKVALRVRAIEAIEIFEDQDDLVGILVNLQDYTVGADEGGNVTLFDDFDIDYNQQKYLIETRVSGALTKFKSALVVRKVAGSAVLVTPQAPDFDGTKVTVKTTTGVVYKDKSDGTTLTTAAPVTLADDETLTVVASPSSGNFYFSNNADDEWSFTNEA